MPRLCEKLSWSPATMAPALLGFELAGASAERLTLSFCRLCPGREVDRVPLADRLRDEAALRSYYVARAGACVSCSA